MIFGLWLSKFVVVKLLFEEEFCLLLRLSTFLWATKQMASVARRRNRRSPQVEPEMEKECGLKS